MPINLIWGDDLTACERKAEDLINEIVDPNWMSINLSKIDGSDISNANRALEEVRTPPLGSGGRVVLVKNSPFCNACPNELANILEASIESIPKNSFLLLFNKSKPDGRLRTTKLIQKLIKLNKASEYKFVLPAFWDQEGQLKLIEHVAKSLGLKLEPEAITFLIESIGTDSARLYSELEKVSLLASANESKNNNNYLLITLDKVQSLIDGLSTNALQISDSLLREDIGEAIARFESLLNSGEPALRILATLTSQVRGWLWVSLLEEEGEKDVGLIAKKAGIANPKRIYVMRKQLRGKNTKQFLQLLSKLLEIEAALKKGAKPGDAFKESLLQENAFS